MKPVVFVPTAAVIAAIVFLKPLPDTPPGILLIRQPDRRPPKWKMPGGEVKEGQAVEVALVEEIGDETGFDIPIHREGIIRKKWVLGNDKVEVHYMGSTKVQGRGGVPHDKHFYIVIAHDPKDVIYLDEKQRMEDDEEVIETKVIPLDQFRTLPDYLEMQNPLRDELFDFIAKRIRAAA